MLNPIYNSLSLPPQPTIQIMAASNPANHQWLATQAAAQEFAAHQ